MTVIDVLDLHNPEVDGDNLTPATVAAIAKAKASGADTIRFPRGVHHFHAEGAETRSYSVSNNGTGPRAIVFPLVGCHDLTIDGGGGEFVFHGRVSPFVIDRSTNVTVRDLSIDCARPFFTQGLVLGAAEGYVDVMVDRGQFPYRVEGGEFYPYAKEWEVPDNVDMLMIEFDPQTKAPQYNGYWNLGRMGRNTNPLPTGWRAKLTKVITASELPSGALRLHGGFDRPYKTGNMLILCHGSRIDSGFVITDSADTRIDSVNIFHIGGMGVIAQLSDTVTCHKLAVKLRPGTDRLLSTNADATHFVNCTGRITLSECVFENMDDDGTNVHGISTPVSRLLADDTVEVALMHPSQHGVNVYCPGDTVNVLDRTSLLTKGTAVVKTSEMTDLEHIRLQFEDSIAGLIEAEDALDNPTRMPEVLIRGCRTGNNRPRGFLITTPKKAVIEDNVFYNSSCGIHITGDANYWFESGGVRDVTIRRNRFEACGYAGNSPAVVVTPEIEHPDAEQGCFHRNITVEDNDFHLHNAGMLLAKSVDGIRFVNNRYEHSDAYPPHPAPRKPTEYIACRNVVEEGNQ